MHRNSFLPAHIILQVFRKFAEQWRHCSANSGECDLIRRAANSLILLCNALAVYEDGPEVWSLLLFIGFLVIDCIVISCFVQVVVVASVDRPAVFFYGNLYFINVTNVSSFK